MPLTDTFLKTIKYNRDDNKPQREYDTEGLYLEITPKGVKKWQMKYKRPITGKENRLSFGIYPEVSLKEARLKRDEARKLLKDGKDPSEAKKEEKRLSTLQANNTFEAIAIEWLSKKTKLGDKTIKNYHHYLSSAFTAFGHKPVNEVTSPDVFVMVK